MDKIKTSVFELSAINKSRSKLPVNIFVDDTGAYWRRNSCRVLRFQNDYNDLLNPTNLLRITIADEPKILGDSTKIEISKEDVEQIKIFISNNKTILEKLSDQEIDIVEFVELLKTE